jgi:PAS domain S-box-containing protein
MINKRSTTGSQGSQEYSLEELQFELEQNSNSRVDDSRDPVGKPEDVLQPEDARRDEFELIKQVHEAGLQGGWDPNALETVFDLIQDCYSHSSISLYQIHPNQQLLTRVYHSSPVPVPGQVGRAAGGDLEIRLLPDSALYGVLLKGKPQSIFGRNAVAEVFASFDPPEVLPGDGANVQRSNQPKSVIVLPLATENELLGVVMLAREKSYDRIDTDRLELLSYPLATILLKKNTLAKLRTSEERARRLFDKVPTGIAQISAEGTILDANLAMAKMLRYPSRNALIAAGVAEIEADPARHQERWCKLQEAENLPEGEYEFRCLDRTTVWVKGSIQGLKSATGELESYELVVSNISDRREILDAHNRLDRLKEEFIARISHDLRTPVSSIRGFLKLLREGKVSNPEIQREFLDRAADDADRLKALVDELLDIYRMEEGELDLQIEKIDIEELIHQSISLVEGLAEEKGIDLLGYPPRKQISIEGDQVRLEQVLSNLVENAVKYADEDQPIAVRVKQMENEVMFQVIDRGPGIPREAQSKLFDKFYRVEYPEKRAHDGTGLGLYIAKRVVEAHGGQIGVTSEPGEGSTFFFVIPLKHQERTKA